MSAARGLPVPLGRGLGWLRLDNVYHGATVAVDERSTEASVSTAVVGIAAVADQEMVLGRPFLFLIRDRDTRARPFLERLVDPRRANG